MPEFLRNTSLRSRILWSFLGLYLLLQALIMAQLHFNGEKIAKRQLQQELAVGESVVRRVLEENGRRLALAARVLAADFAFREAIATRDAGTIHSVLDNHGRRIGAEMSMLFDLNGRMLASTASSGVSAQATPRGSNAGTRLVVIDGRLLQLVTTPVLAPTPIAWMVMGFPVDDDLAGTIGSMTKLDITFASIKDDRISGLLATSLPIARRTWFTNALVGRSADQEVKLDQQSWETRQVQMVQAEGVVLMLHKSLTEALEPHRELSGRVFLLGVLGLLVFAAIGRVLTLGITRPLQRLADATERLSQGQLADMSHESLVDPVASQEVRKLGERFDHLRVALSDRERELADLLKHLEDKVASRTSELRSTNLTLAERNRRLAELDREKNEILAIAAHDLKNPLFGIRMGLEYLGDSENLTSEGQQVLQEVDQSIQRMRDIITRLLDLQALETGKMKLHLELCNAAATLSELAGMHESAARAKSIELITEIPGPVLAYTDASALSQVVDNLVSNAIKYSPRGTTVWAKCVQENGYCLIAVRDQGPGFTDEDKTRLFGKFARLSAKPTAGEHSTGLGLSIVKRLIEAMHGKVWVESEAGQGATFKVALPLGSPDDIDGTLMGLEIAIPDT